MTVSSGVDILREYARALDASPDFADPGVHLAFVPRIRSTIQSLEGIIAQNPGMSREELALLQADLTMLRDVADQSTKHLPSLMTRVRQYLSTRAENGAPRAKPPSGNGAMPIAGTPILLAIAVLLILLMVKR